MIKINKALGVRDNWDTDWYQCSYCRRWVIATGFNFCPNCGERIEWVGEDENE